MSQALPGPVGGKAGAFNYRLWCSDPFGFLSDIAGVYGDVVGFHLGDSPCILINGAPEVRELLTRHEMHLRKPGFVRNSNRAHWGDGLTTLEADAWQARRKVLRPCFSSAMVSSVSACVLQCTTDMLDSWDAGSVVDLQYELRMLVARIALRTVLDADIEGLGEAVRRSGLVSRQQAYGVDYCSTVSGDAAAPLWQIRPRAPSCMGEVVRVIDERLLGGETRPDILSTLLQQWNHADWKADRDDIVGEIMQMLYAGHLTIPAALMSFWKEMATCSALSQLEAEADRYSARGYRDPVSQVGSRSLAMLKESLRLHPPAPVLYREVETAFDLCGYGFESGALVLVCPQLLHRDSRYFAHPELFMPERFLAGDDNTGNPLVSQDVQVDGRLVSAAPYLPFGMGPRTCIASHLAMQQMTQMALLVSGRFSLQPTTDSSTRFLLQPRR